MCTAWVTRWCLSEWYGGLNAAAAKRDDRGLDELAVEARVRFVDCGAD